MINSLLTKDKIQIVSSVYDYQAAIQLACKPLIDAKNIEPKYVDAILQSHTDMGPYYVLGPRIAMPHARPENGVNDLSLSLLVVKDGVSFGSPENDPVTLIVVLCAIDNNSHITLMSELADLFMNSEDVSKISNSNSVADIQNILKSYG